MVQNKSVNIKNKPNEIYIWQSHASTVSFYTTFTNAIGTLNILESIKSNKLEKFLVVEMLEYKCKTISEKII